MEASAKSPQSAVDDPASGSDWVRVERDGSGQPTAMQTAVVRYTGRHEETGRPIEVDLIGAVHVGDSAYYTALNERFRSYDALLYELVAPEGTVIQPGAKASTRNPLGALQGGMKSILELEHQLEKIDYTADNFVHADMSPDEFFKSMENRNEGLLQMYLRMIGQGIAAQSTQSADSPSTDFEMLFAFFASDRARRLKIAMAKQLSEIESLLTGFGGEKGSTIITERNRVAMEVLDRELRGGRRRVGVFYGAGHLEDMDARLKRDFGLQPTSVEWLTAWDLRPASDR